jgi:hypothetical protein
MEKRKSLWKKKQDIGAGMADRTIRLQRKPHPRSRKTKLGGNVQDGSASKVNVTQEPPVLAPLLYSHWLGTTY